MERLRPFRACRADDKAARGAHDETGDDETGAHDETGEQAARRSDGTPAREVVALRAPSVDRVERAGVDVLGKTAGGGTAGSTAGGTALLTSRHRPRVTKPPPAAISGSISSISASSAAISLSSLLDYSTDYGVGYLAWLGLGLGLVTLTLTFHPHLSPSPSPSP